MSLSCAVSSAFLALVTILVLDETYEIQDRDQRTLAE